MLDLFPNSAVCRTRRNASEAAQAVGSTVAKTFGIASLTEHRVIVKKANAGRVSVRIRHLGKVAVAKAEKAVATTCKASARVSRHMSIGRASAPPPLPR